ncbi:TPA: ribonuclease toxin immunity protein CdiI [Klebsiella oxytoca]|jgi:hypothetical protein|uniref:ribonuclease toxin immunity protein CdiI n=1 Tax=Klebsiella oxytoca TaxID=571 RepID=UPI001BD2A9D0|nr:ribonuclease toxin immunity protein CdiI [Klebsiella oxytoca]MDM4273721.1 ribonuclease toxin immunity protein CdiI [Klebsiella oxytoca]
MSEYIFEKVDCDNDPEWVVKEFFNSLNLSGNLHFGVERIVDKCGFGIEDTYCHFPDLEGSDPDFYFQGIMFGVWGGEIVVDELTGYKYTLMASEKYCLIHPEEKHKFERLMNKLTYCS